MLKNVIKKPDGYRISIHVSPDDTYSLIRTNLAVGGHHKIHRYGSNKYSTYEEARLKAMKL